MRYVQGMEKRPIIGISIVAIAILLVANVSMSIAQEPEVFFKDIQIIPGSVQKTDQWNVIFSVCVDGPGDGVDSVMDPRILVTSDLETRPMQLRNIFHANECQGSIQQIRANDPQSISLKVISFGNYDQIEAMEENLKKLEFEFEREIANLQSLKEVNFPSNQAYIDQVRRQADHVNDLRRNLQHQTEQFYQILYNLHPDIKGDEPLPTSVSVEQTPSTVCQGLNCP